MAKREAHTPAPYMKVQLETIVSQLGQSFSLMFNPRLSDLFYWHFHPEYELVYIEAESGPRHVGAHASRYAGSDLVLIGSDIPHLNFDYGLQGDYRKVVVHLKKDLVERQWGGMPELEPLHLLFRKNHSLASVCSIWKGSTRPGSTLNSSISCSNWPDPTTWNSCTNSLLPTSIRYGSRAGSGAFSLS